MRHYSRVRETSRDLQSRPSHDVLGFIDLGTMGDRHSCYNRLPRLTSQSRGQAALPTTVLCTHSRRQLQLDHPSCQAPQSSHTDLTASVTVDVPPECRTVTCFTDHSSPDGSSIAPSLPSLFLNLYLVATSNL